MDYIPAPSLPLKRGATEFEHKALLQLNLDEKRSKQE